MPFSLHALNLLPRCKSEFLGTTGDRSFYLLNVNPVAKKKKKKSHWFGVTTPKTEPEASVVTGHSHIVGHTATQTLHSPLLSAFTSRIPYHSPSSLTLPWLARDRRISLRANSWKMSLWHTHYSGWRCLTPRDVNKKVGGKFEYIFQFASTTFFFFFYLVSRATSLNMPTKQYIRTPFSSFFLLFLWFPRFHIGLKLIQLSFEESTNRN